MVVIGVVVVVVVHVVVVVIPFVDPKNIPVTLINAEGGGTIILLHLRIAFSPERNIRWTQDQSVNSSLSVVVQ